MELGAVLSHPRGGDTSAETDTSSVFIGYD
jgi:hypothetical protein